MNHRIFILGAGMTGLAAGLLSGLPIYEASKFPGGICSSYYMRPEGTERFPMAPKDGEVYRFEVGGGHWIFGYDPFILRFIHSIIPVKSYVRKSAIYFADQDFFVPYPIQNHLRYLRQELAAKILREIMDASRVNHPVTTMADWLRASFGPTLCELFFEPFHELYTAGLWKQIAPQDTYKSPVDISLTIQGAFNNVPSVGYNVTFVYPEEGLNALAQKMASHCQVYYGKGVSRIDVKDKVVYFEDGSDLRYEVLISTLPLNRMMEITSLSVDECPNPSSSVFVINIGAIKGQCCPEEHWIYIPKSKSRFHRVGFYSNVDISFLPVFARKTQNRVSIYVEKAYPEGQKPDKLEIKALCHEVVKELQEWGWIGETEVVDSTWIDVAYTWSWPGSRWRERALKVLEEHDIYQVGRFARWLFQGIADSVKDGIIAGGSFKIRRLRI